MSQQTDPEIVVGEVPRPQTVSLSKLRQRSNSGAEAAPDMSIGEAFFPGQSDIAPEDDLLAKDGSESSAELSDMEDGIINRSAQNSENGSPGLRPKTVTIERSNERKQRLLDMGAISSQDSDTQDDAQPFEMKKCSPRPKADRCYICGKEFLLSSLKVHERQCAKKSQRETERKLSGRAQSGKATAFVESNVSRKPKLEACYLCGREFFVHSLGIHETQCIKNWKANKTPDAKHKSISERTGIDVRAAATEAMHEQRDITEKKAKEVGPQKQAANRSIGSPKCGMKMGGDATSGSRQKGLRTTPCYVCGVQFLPHSLKIHEKKCRGRPESKGVDKTELPVKEKKLRRTNAATAKNDVVSDIVTGVTDVALQGNADQSQKMSQGETLVRPKETENPLGPTSTPRRPRTIICYICGQEFLKSSYAVHEKQCASKSKAKAEQEESRSGKNPKGPSRAQPAARKHNTSENTQGRETPAKKPKTQRCFICGKEVLMSSLRIHEQQCQKKSEILKNINQQSMREKRPPSQRNARAIGPKPKTEVCYICGEAFLASSIKVHEAQCEKRWNSNQRR